VGSAAFAWREPMTSNQGMARKRRIGVLLGVMLFLGSAYFYQDPEWNGNSRLNLTRAIVEQASLSIDDFHDAPDWATGDKAYFQGHYYTDKAIGSSVMAVPVYFALFKLGGFLAVPLGASLIKHVLTTCVMGAMFAVAGISMYSIGVRVAPDAWIAILATLCVAFGTMMWPYSAVFYGHVPAAAFLILTFALLAAAASSSDHGSPWQWFWIGLAAAMAFISDFTAAPVIAGLAAYGLYVLRGRNLGRIWQTAWPALLGALIPWTVLVSYNLAVYGRPLDFGYTYEVEERFQEIMGLGLMGMRLPTLSASYHISLDPKFGLLWQSPVLWLSPVGYWLAFLHRRHRAEVLLSMYAIGVVFLMNAASFLWYGGSTFGPRLLISALPFFVVPLAMLPKRASWTLAALGTLSAAQMLIPLVGKIQFTRLEFDPARGGFHVDGTLFSGLSLLYGYGLSEVVRLQELGQSPWTLGTGLGLPLWISLLLLVAAESALLVIIRRNMERPERES
jgi:hypothetical protein